MPASLQETNRGSVSRAIVFSCIQL